jgi:hypothetical protein
MEIKFRALKDDASNCTFVYGQLVYDAVGTPRITHNDISNKGLTFNTCLKGTEGMYTGFQDMEGNEIFDGDLLEHDMYKKCEVFWCQKTGMWRLRQSYGQAKPTSSPLYRELELFNYKINGNIHER